jgi:hypothetical protein
MPGVGHLLPPLLTAFVPAAADRLHLLLAAAARAKEATEPQTAAATHEEAIEAEQRYAAAAATAHALVEALKQPLYMTAADGCLEAAEQLLAQPSEGLAAALLQPKRVAAAAKAEVLYMAHAAQTAAAALHSQQVAATERRQEDAKAAAAVHVGDD